jgi:nucleoside-diphosphate-sugar epimerase
MKIFLTGSTGFIGTHLAHRLVSAGCSVLALVRDPQKAARLPKQGIEFLRGDMGIFKNPDLILPICDVVIHVAGIIHAPTLKAYHQINAEAVGDLLALLKRQKWRPRRLVFASSLAAAGPTIPGKPLCEEDPLCPNEPYGASKKAAEEILATADFPVTVFRPGMVIGSGDPAILTLFKMARRGMGFRVAGLNPHFSYVSVADLVDAVWKMAQDGRTGTFKYFVGHDVNANVNVLWKTLERVMQRRIRVVPLPRALLWSLMEMATLVAKVLPIHNQLDAREYIQMTTPAYLASSINLKQDLGWQALHNFEDSMKMAYEGYIRDGWLKL